MAQEMQDIKQHIKEMEMMIPVHMIPNMNERITELEEDIKNKFNDKIDEMIEDKLQNIKDEFIESKIEETNEDKQ